MTTPEKYLETAEALCPKVGKLYRAVGPLGTTFANVRTGFVIPIMRDSIFLVTAARIQPGPEPAGARIIFSILFENRLLEDLAGYPIWFEHHFKRVT